MSEERFALGFDFGTESCRALLVNVGSGHECATAVFSYPHGVIDRELPGTGVELGQDWALQHPADYLLAIKETTTSVMRQARIRPEQVIGIGIDFTACTLLPTDREGNPLCLDERFAAEPNAWVKLWKHHAAQPEADRINEMKDSLQAAFLDRYGGKISSEWLIPKVWQTLNEAPQVYEAAERFIEAGDWIVWQLTGEEKRSACMAGYKACWIKGQGYPSKKFLAALDERLGDLVHTRLVGDVLAPGTLAGYLTEKMAAELGLAPRTPVAVPIIDDHAAVPACTVKPNELVLILGTSFCHLMLGEQERLVPGISGVVEDGILPGYYGYEAGQAAGGDIFAWFVENAVPAKYETEAAGRGIGLHAILEEKAASLRPGQSGLIALDWWNGNRSVLVDAELTGVLVGYTLSTTAEEVYRALLEATAFGTRKIIRTMEEAGLRIESCIACGGVAEKSSLLLQVFADVTGREIRTCAARESCALGAAMLGTLAAGSQNHGYDSLQKASEVMSNLSEKPFVPAPRAVAVYDQLYDEYEKLHDYFGLGRNQVMKLLKRQRHS